MPLYGTSKKLQSGNTCLQIDGKRVLRDNCQLLRKWVFRPYIKGLCIRMICFYQRHLSRHTCLYQPTCSEYTKRCINNFGAVIGILLGAWRILRCNPLSKGGIDPAPELPYKKKWLL